MKLFETMAPAFGKRAFKNRARGLLSLAVIAALLGVVPGVAAAGDDDDALDRLLLREVKVAGGDDASDEIERIRIEIEAKIAALTAELEALRAQSQALRASAGKSAPATIRYEKIGGKGDSPFARRVLGKIAPHDGDAIAVISGEDGDETRHIIRRILGGGAQVKNTGKDTGIDVPLGIHVEHAGHDGHGAHDGHEGHGKSVKKNVIILDGSGVHGGGVSKGGGIHTHEQNSFALADNVEVFITNESDDAPTALSRRMKVGDGAGGSFVFDLDETSGQHKVESHGKIVIEHNGERTEIDFDPRQNKNLIEQLHRALEAHGGAHSLDLEFLGDMHAPKVKVRKQKGRSSAPKVERRIFRTAPKAPKAPKATKATKATKSGGSSCCCPCCQQSAGGGNAFFFGGPDGSAATEIHGLIAGLEKVPAGLIEGHAPAPGATGTWVPAPPPAPHAPRALRLRNPQPRNAPFPAPRVRLETKAPSAPCPVCGAGGSAAAPRVRTFTFPGGHGTAEVIIETEVREAPDAEGVLEFDIIGEAPKVEVEVAPVATWEAAPKKVKIEKKGIYY